jgi:hypothetical protein
MIFARSLAMRLVIVGTCAITLSCLALAPSTISFMLVSATPAAAQQDDLDAMVKRHSELMAAGNYASALAEAQKYEAAVKARLGVNHARYAGALFFLANVTRAQGNYAQLELNADWVVLSACNTAAGDKPGAEALSGLARAFFYAGAHALLVSHWKVDSDAAAGLTTTTFDILRRDPKLGRAEALRRAMLDYMNGTADPLSPYPALWAPFVVVGEGGAR